ncbi:LptF/LptG family permease [bacterium]|nr:LptF/LptG family permease [bacterium]
MKTLDRWILRKFAVTYAIFAAAILIVFIVTDSLNKLGTFMGAGGSLASTWLGYYGALLPDIYYMLAPFVTLTAGLWVVHDLKRHNEFVPILSAGLPPWRIVTPIFLAAAFLAFLMFLDREYVIPAASIAQLRKEQSKLVKHAYLIPSPIPDKSGGVLSARFFDTKKQELDEPRYTLLDAQGRETVSAIASTAFHHPADAASPNSWVFRDGILIRCEPGDGGEHVAVVRIPASGMAIETDIEPLDVESSIYAITYLSTDQMRRQYERCPFLRHLGVQLERRYSYPSASVILLLLGLPFVLRGDKGDKAQATIGVLACMGICALFFLVTAFCEDMGARPGGAHPRLAAWLPNLLFGVPGIVAFLRAAR